LHQKIECSQIINPENMVRVGMSEKNPIYVPNLVGKALHAKVGPSINQ
jgi:hypothetical protein